MPKNKQAKAVLAKKASNGIKLKDILIAEFLKKSEGYKFTTRAQCKPN